MGRVQFRQVLALSSRDNLSSTTFNFSPSAFVLASNQLNNAKGWDAGTGQIIDPTAADWVGILLRWTRIIRVGVVIVGSPRSLSGCVDNASTPTRWCTSGCNRRRHRSRRLASVETFTHFGSAEQLDDVP